MEEKLRKIMKHFGMEHQRAKLKEEALEYIESGDDEEIADLFVLSFQLFLNSAIIQKLVWQKIKRTLIRIKEGYYEA